MTALASGFPEPVHAAQEIFRAVMLAMARPGTAIRVSVALSPPPPLSPVLGAIALTLLDYETPLWLDASLASNPDVSAWIRFHTGAPVIEASSGAAFALVSDPSRIPLPEELSLGTAEFPDRSTTVVVQVVNLDGQPKLKLRGPGIPGTREFAPSGVPADFKDILIRNQDFFPRGIDFILADAACIAALPRTVRIAGDRACMSQ